MEASECYATARIQTTTKWPNQPRPGPNHRNTWKRFLKSLCEENSNQLSQQLGVWTSNTYRHKQNANTYVDEANNIVYFNHETTWMRQKFIQKRRYCNAMLPIETTVQPNVHNLIPVEMSYTAGSKHIHWRKRQSNTTASNETLSWEVYTLQNYHGGKPKY
jgi:hypothetical protein